MFEPIHEFGVLSFYNRSDVQAKRKFDGLSFSSLGYRVFLRTDTEIILDLGFHTDGQKGMAQPTDVWCPRQIPFNFFKDRI